MNDIPFELPQHQKGFYGAASAWRVMSAIYDASVNDFRAMDVDLFAERRGVEIAVFELLEDVMA